MTTALYRRYRPDTFADLIGQEHVTGPLMQALRTGRVGHAYLFSGPRGCGKTTSARILARCLNCEQGPTAEPCGACDSCVALARGGPGSVDVIEIDAASHGGVDDARDLRERASYAPAQSRYKIYIIDEAHMVTSAGFNALLKIVEEPPEHVKFVFATTEPEKVIGTIRSRTHHYPFRLVPPGHLTEYLLLLCEQEQVPVAAGALSFVVRAGGGSVRDSLSVLDQLIAGSGDEGVTYELAASLLGFTDAELLDATIDAFAAGDGAAVFRQIDRVIESGLDPRRFVEDLLERLRDLIIVAAVPDGSASVFRGVPADQLERMRVQQSHFGPGSLSRAADIVNAGLTEMTGATSPRLQLELICARVLLPAASGEGGYAARLDRLEKRLDLAGAPTGRAAVTAVPYAAPATSEPPSAPPPEVPVSPAERPRPEDRPVPERQQAARAPAQTGGWGTSTTPPASPQEQVRHETARPELAAPQPSTGEMDTDALRRAWPGVLDKISGMRRATWSFVSQNAQVQSFDGRRLVLSIGTVGLANTFRSGNHADLVRQALREQLGVDCIVEGIVDEQPPADPANLPDPEPPGGLSTPAAGPSPRQAVQAPGSAPITNQPQPNQPEAQVSQASSGSTWGSVGFVPEANDGWGSGRGAAPDWATAEPPAAESDPEDDPSAYLGDDVEDLGSEAGPGVIEQILGGKVLSEGAG